MTQRESFNVWRDHYLSEGMGPREADLEASKRIVEANNQQKLRPWQGLGVTPGAGQLGGRNE